MGCNNCGRRRTNRNGNNNTNKELEYLRRYRYLTPKQLERRRVLEEEEKRREEQNVDLLSEVLFRSTL